MTREEAIAALDGLDDDSPLYNHETADKTLLEFLAAVGFADVAEAWKRADDRCGGFWYD